jgi:hypothetical protein
VDRRVARRDDLAADVVEPVDRLVHRALVARNRRGGEDDRVAGVQPHLRVVAMGHAAQGAQRLALGACRDDHELLVGPVVELARREQDPLGDRDVAQRAPDVDVLAHGAPDERHLAPERRGRVHHLLDAVDVRRERGDDDPPLAAQEDVLQVGADRRLAGREAGTVGVRRVAAQQQHALGAQLGQARDVRGHAVDRRLVELVVTRDEHGAELRPHRHREGVGDRVGHVDELDVERAQLEVLAGLDVLEVDLAQAVLVELGPCHRGGERPPEDGDVGAQLPQDPGQGADVILVAVRDDDALDVVHPSRR